ncbi:Uncharacterised protein [Bordetella pertussis]|nr:Uncharacterised protein [Bordetella pertussis]CFW30433.1 Uncharacterised protein [Bordetella pertussis]
MPQARISSESISLKTLYAPSPNSSGVIDSMSCSVSPTARGCSKISFCMKWRYGPSSAAPVCTCTVCALRSTCLPAWSTIHTRASCRSTTSPSSR